jgi:hypothetical protein
VTRELPPDMMPLSEAAALAHRELFRGTLADSPDALDVVATALSGHLAIYGIKDPAAGRTQLTEEDYSGGSFRRGATRFERREGGSIVNLSVRKLDFEKMLSTLRPAREDKAS